MYVLEGRERFMYCNPFLRINCTVPRDSTLGLVTMTLSSLAPLGESGTITAQQNSAATEGKPSVRPRSNAPPSLRRHVEVRLDYPTVLRFGHHPPSPTQLLTYPSSHGGSEAAAEGEVTSPSVQGVNTSHSCSRRRFCKSKPAASAQIERVSRRSRWPAASAQVERVSDRPRWTGWAGQGE